MAMTGAPPRGGLSWPQAGLQATRLWRALLAVLVVVVTWLALAPQPPAEISLGWDKLNHAAAFSALAFSAWLGFPGARRRTVALAALLAYGGLIEVLQSWLPPRQAEVADLLADAVGLLAGAALAAAAWRLLARPPARPRDATMP